MIFDDVPFWSLLIYTIMPIVIAMLLFIRSVSLFKQVIDNFKNMESDVLLEMGTLMLYIIALSTIIGLIYLLAVEDLNGMDIFDFMVYEMLPPTVYAILLYGILAELKILFNRKSGGIM